MARKLRIEYEHAFYHVINRGNYRAEVFVSDGAKEAFEKCLGEACEKAGWVLHAYVIMRNHYHLALETPRANLVDGMRWLQAAFANRLNRFRRERGHVFQGRYQAIVVEDAAALGAVSHYIHLNPVRAGVVPMAHLSRYRHGSFPWLTQPRRRPAWLDFSIALEAAGGLADTPAGRRKYLQYLSWLAEDKPAQKALGFARLSHGWVHGSKAFKQALMDEQREAQRSGAVMEAEVREAREIAWEQLLQRCLRRLRRTEAAAVETRKSAPWKVAIAAHLKRVSTVKNPWLAQRLHMGDPDGVSRYCSECHAGARPEAAALLVRITDIRV
jgi:REP element-mobilizing transposase RayT